MAVMGLLVLAAGALWPAMPMIFAEAPPPLPDLYIGPGDIVLFVYGHAAQSAVNGTRVVIDVTVHNAGPGVSGSAAVSLYDDGDLIATIPVNETIDASGPYNFSQVELLWDTADAPGGMHTIRAGAADPSGDANISNNSASVDFEIETAPALSISLSPLVLEATVSESSMGQAEFNGTVTVDKRADQNVTVQLTATADNRWQVSLSPSRMVLTSSSSQNFSVIVRVPQATPAAAGRLRIEARATGEGYDLHAGANATVTVRPYIRVMIESDVPYVELAPGGTARFTMKVWNNGNSIDSFNISIDNIQDLKNDGWSVTLNPDNVTGLAPGEPAYVNITAKAPMDWVLWTSEPTMIVLTAESQDAPGIHQTFPCYAYVKGFNMRYVAVLCLSIVAIVVVIVVVAFIVWRRWRRAARQRFREQMNEDYGFGRPVNDRLAAQSLESDCRPALRAGLLAVRLHPRPPPPESGGMPEDFKEPPAG